MNYRGDLRLGDTLDFKFTTRSFTTGAPTTLAGSPAIAAYPDNSTTELTAGITLSVDFDSRTGLNNVRVVATSGNGYAAGTNYDLVITAGTVGGVSVVGEVVGSFSIEKRSALMPTTAARTLDVSAAGEAGIDWANIGSPTTAQNLSSTNIDTDQVVASVAGAVGSVTGAVTVGAIGNNVITALSINNDAITDAKVAADVTIASVTGSVGSVTGAVGSVTADVGITQAGADKVWASAARTLTSFGTLVADMATAVWGAATRLLTAGTNIVLAKGTGITGFNDPTVGAIADQVWDEILSGHAIGGSTGAALAAAGSAGDPWITALPGAYGAGTAGHIIGNMTGGTAGAGAITWAYTLTSSAGGLPIPDADVWVTSDLAGLNVLASGRTNQNGVVTFFLDAGTVYVWRQKSGWNFTNPDTETVS